MGLDLVVMAKPLAGHEAESAALVRQFMIHKGLIFDDRPDTRSLFQRIIGKKLPRLSDAELEALDQRYKAITVPAYANLGAPIVGQDNVADDWVATLFAEGKFHDPAVTSLEKALAQTNGIHVLELLPPNDGLPFYTHGTIGLVDLTSFRGKFVELCTDILNDDQRLQVWGVMDAGELLQFGQELAKVAQSYAVAKGLTEQLGQREVGWEDDSDPRAQLHIVDSLGRWAIFWGGRGHGCEPFF